MPAYWGYFVLTNDLQEGDATAALFRSMVRCALNNGESVTDCHPPGHAIDWDHLCRLFEAHGLLSLLGARAEFLGRFAMPPALCRSIKEYAQGNSLRNRMLLQEYRELVQALRAIGIEPVALKGIASISRIDGYESIRELADIDILITRQQIRAARELLEHRGYQTVYAPDTVMTGAAELSEDQADVYRHVYHEFSFVSPDGLVYVDVHWQLSPSVYPTGIPADLPLTDIAEQGVLSPPYELVYLCMHAAKDGWSELKWAIDIAGLMKSFSASQWELTWNLAQRFRMRRILLTGIALAEWLTGQTAPILDSYADKKYCPPAGTLAQLRNRLMRTPERKHRLVSCLGLNKTYIALCDESRDKLIYIFRMFTYPQPRDFIRLGLTPRILPAWGLLRPFAITVHCLFRAFRFLVLGRRSLKDQ